MSEHPVAAHSRIPTDDKPGVIPERPSFTEREEKGLHRIVKAAYVALAKLTPVACCPHPSECHVNASPYKGIGCHECFDQWIPNWLHEYRAAGGKAPGETSTPSGSIAAGDAKSTASLNEMTLAHNFWKHNSEVLKAEIVRLSEQVEKQGKVDDRG